MPSTILDQEKLDVLISAYQAGCLLNDREASDEDLQHIIEWAEQTVIGSALLENILSGNVTPGFKEGEVFFQITPHGKKEAESILWDNRQSDLVQ